MCNRLGLLFSVCQVNGFSSPNQMWILARSYLESDPIALQLGNRRISAGILLEPRAFVGAWQACVDLLDKPVSTTQTFIHIIAINAIQRARLKRSSWILGFQKISLELFAAMTEMASVWKIVQSFLGRSGFQLLLHYLIDKQSFFWCCNRVLDLPEVLPWRWTT